MSIVKMIELSSQSSESWEDATRQAVERASRSLRNIRSVWVKEFEAVVDANKVTRFRVYEGAPAIREADLGHANAVDGTLPSREMSKAVHG
jgi:flavin-binding protein dodecin